ncbi:MAG: hypothetical protein KA515_02795 [Candidatus Pacebacteria bacterium]|nr:hypothetical protein [Candidatus Paceibacterota bacterium]
MNWALRRQILDLLILFGVLGVFGFFIIYPYFNVGPSCADGRQNGTEKGVDCGGSCARACLADTESVSVLWSRAFKVIPGRYNAVAYLSNHNKNKAANKVNYRFRFTDANNLYIGKREGTTFIPPVGNFAIFEPAVGLGSSVPVYTTFEFTSVPDWTVVQEEKINQLKILVSNIQLMNTDTNPKLLATITNNSLFSIPEVNVVAILYDVLGNAISVSQTYVEVLAGEEQKDLTYTWQEPISENVVSKQIIPMFNVFKAQLR